MFLQHLQPSGQTFHQYNNNNETLEEKPLHTQCIHSAGLRKQPHIETTMSL